MISKEMVAARLPLDQPWTILAIGTSCVGVWGVG
jgi:hypothetical protein